MSLASGTRIGPYTVTAPLGEGGMGIVFRARDTKLQRDVALKLLPDHFAEDADRLLRFQREAQVLASLNHPNDARIEIEEALSAQPAEAVPEAARTRKPVLAWIVAAITTLAFASLAIVNFRERPVAEVPEMRVEITTPSTQGPLEFALSPDGRYIVMVASGDGPQRLWLRALDKTDAQPMVGTEGANYPFWSPDSRSIGFTATGKLKRIDIGWTTPDFGQHFSASWRCLECGRHDPVYRGLLGSAVSHSGVGRRAGCCHTARSTANGSTCVPAISARWPPFYLLRLRNSGGSRHLSGFARRR